MPVFQLNEQFVFPDPQLANDDGIIAVGGDLKPERLLQAYANGIFPWYEDGEPIMWWSPDPRMVLFPEEIRVSKSMRKVFNRGEFIVTLDKDFPAIIEACQTQPRKGQQGTWITEEMQNAYIKLHELGYAHSAEVWQGEQLVAGVYGVSLGNAFFAESMFTTVSNASKVGLITLVKTLQKNGFSMLDCQVHTDHSQSLGGKEIPRSEFLERLKECLKQETIVGNWGDWLNVGS